MVYRVLAYRRAAKTLRETPESVARLSEQGKLVELPNIGVTINDKVTELLATGSIAALDKVIARNPPGAVAVMHVPGDRTQDGAQDLQRAADLDRPGRCPGCPRAAASATCPEWVRRPRSC